MPIIATSIAPFNINQQILSVRTWLDAGFEVISVNVRNEIDVLADKFTGVRFLEANGSALEKHGKPFIYIDELLAVLDTSGERICGIANADICFRSADIEAFGRYIVHAAVDSMIYGSRIDIPSNSNLEGEYYSKGFDFFFFDSSFIGLYGKSDFCLGAPWWDYWFPLGPLLNGKKLKQLRSPIAFHVVHGDRWDSYSYIDYGTSLVSFVEGVYGSLLPDQLVHRLQGKANRNDDLAGYADELCRYITYSSEDIFFNSLDPLLRTVALSEKQYFVMLQQLKEVYKFGLDRGTGIESLLEELESCRHGLESIENSFIWRSTRLLREIADKIN